MISSISSAQEQRPDPQDMGELLEQMGAWRELRRGQTVEGVVMRVDQEGILVNLGGKSEGLVPPREMQSLSVESLEAIQVGDPLLTYILRPETDQGHAFLSVDRARSEQGWHRLESALESGESVEATVADQNRGGLVVNVDGVEGFVPLSHLAPPAPEEALKNGAVFGDHRVGQQMRLKVLEVEQQRQRAVLSERQAWQAWRAEQKERLLGELQEGEVRKGLVTGISSFGAFVDLGGAEGLIHISELAWGSVGSPGEVVQAGNEVEVYVLRVDRENGRIGLSLRRLQPGPWDTITDTYQEGQLVTGTVTRLTPFGAFARLDGNVEGLVHISELSEKRINHPKEVVKEGEVLTLKILRIEPERQRLGLSLKQAAEEA